MFKVRLLCAFYVVVISNFINFLLSKVNFILLCWLKCHMKFLLCVSVNSALATPSIIFPCPTYDACTIFTWSYCMYCLSLYSRLSCFRIQYYFFFHIAKFINMHGTFNQLAVHLKGIIARHPRDKHLFQIPLAVSFEVHQGEWLSIKCGKHPLYVQYNVQCKHRV